MYFQNILPRPSLASKGIKKISQFIACLFFVFLPSLTSAQELDSNFHIYILVGQSNMAGRGPISQSYKVQHHDRLLMLNNENQWTVAMHPLHFDKPKAVGVGPGLAFGIAIADAQKDKHIRIGLVPGAVGGTAISSWEPKVFDKVTGTHPLDDAILRIKEAQKYGVIKGIIWHQGEADTRENNIEVYLDRLTVLIGRLRKVSGNPELPFIAGEIGDFRRNATNFNKELRKLPKNVAHTSVVSSEGLWHKGDGTHFDSPSASELGRRYATAMLQIQDKESAPPKIVDNGGYNTLSLQEREEGWEMLFDGSQPEVWWKGFKGDRFPSKGWMVKDNALVLLPGRKGGDIITRVKFKNFELSLDYRLSDSANTGVKYFVDVLKTKNGKVEVNGPEFQLIDDYKNETVKNNKSPETSTGSLYLLYAPKDKVLNPPGEWNTLRIVAKNKHVEHWLNGKKVLSYERGSEEFKKLVADTKFNNYETPYGESEEGAFLIQDHNDEAWFRNIKVRRLD